MKKYFAVLSQILVIGLIILNGFAAKESAAQVKGLNQFDLAEDNRPFDFSDKYYEENGVNPALIVNRRNGADKLSVFDFTRDPRFRNVRITGTFPAYDRDGNILYWNYYGDLYKESFIENRAGDEAMAQANRYPIFTFPSETAVGDRQAVLIETDDAYFEKNVLGLGVYVSVEYTDKIHTTEGKQILDELADKNGLSLDGTPIIKTTNEINFLWRMELVKQTIRGTNDKSRPPFVIAKILDNLQKSAIAPDAFLLFVNQPGTIKPLPAEEFFVTNFECLQKENEFCSAK
jgi:hypothetical protein